MKASTYKRKIASLRRELQNKKIELDKARCDFASFMNERTKEQWGISTGDKVRIETTNIITECFYGGFVCDLSDAALVGYPILPNGACGTRRFFISGRIVNIEKL